MTLFSKMRFNIINQIKGINKHVTILNAYGLGMMFLIHKYLYDETVKNMKKNQEKNNL